jgi:hypothetical protein
MKSKLSFIVAVLSISQLGLASDYLVQKSRRVADQIRVQSNRLTADQERSIDYSLSEIEKVLGDDSSSTSGRFVCASKDNDGNAPFIATFEKNPVSVVKFPNVVFGSMYDCESSLQRSRTFRTMGVTYACASKDNDGRSPFSIHSMDTKNGVSVSLPSSAEEDLGACNLAVNDMKEYADGVGYCGSKDNDGRSPWSLTIIFRNGTAHPRDESFNSYSSCAAKLN